MYYKGLADAGQDLLKVPPPGKLVGDTSSKLGSPDPKRTKSVEGEGTSTPTLIAPDTNLLASIEALIERASGRQLREVDKRITAAVSSLRKEVGTGGTPSASATRSSSASAPAGAGSASRTDPVIPPSDKRPGGIQGQGASASRPGGPSTSAQADGEMPSTSSGETGSRSVLTGPRTGLGDRGQPLGRGSFLSITPTDSGSVTTERTEDSSSEQDEAMDQEEVASDGEESETLTFAAALEQMRTKLSVVMPQTVVKAAAPDPGKFRLPGEAFAVAEAPLPRLCILPSIREEVIEPLLVHGLSSEVKGLNKLYVFGGEDLFALPVVDACVLPFFTSKAKPRGTKGASKRCLPPFGGEQAPALRLAYKGFEALFRSAAQQLKVAVYSAYLAGLRQQLTVSSVAKASASDQELLGGQLGDLHSYITRDGVRVASAAMMEAVLGMRRLWLSVSSLSEASQRSLLELPFKLGSTLFAGAQAVITEAAEAAAQFKDSKALLERPKVVRKPGLPALPPVQREQASWATPMHKKGKRKSKGRGRGKGAAGSGQQQPFRAGGKSS